MAHPHYRRRGKRRKSLLGRILLWTVSIVVVLIVALVIAMPWILRAAVPEAFARLGLEASVSGGSLSLLRREVILENFVLGSPDAPALSLGELGVGVGVRALLRGRVKLDHLRVREVEVEGERLLALREQLRAGPESRRGALPVALDTLELEDIRLLAVGERIGHDVRISRLEVGNLGALTTDGTSSVMLKGGVGEGSIDVQIEVRIEEDTLEATGSYRVDALPLRGWARLGNAGTDPVTGGAARGRGEVRAAFAFDTEKLDVMLDGRLGFDGLATETASLQAERGDAEWQGRLVLGWSADSAAVQVRADGRLDLETLHVTLGEPRRPRLRAVIDDASWHGDFNSRDGFEIQGGVLGTRIELSDVSKDASAWRARGEDFSWRLEARTGQDAGKFDVRIEDFDLARLDVSAANGDTPMEIAVEKLAVDELRSAQSGDMVLGEASADTLTVDAAGGDDSVTVKASRLSASGLSGDASGTLQVARVSSEALEFVDADRRLHLEEIEFSSVGLSASAWLGSDQVSVKSVRIDQGPAEIWLSGVKATRVHGDAGGRFGAESLRVAQLFQSGSAELSWEASGLSLAGIDAHASDSAAIAKIDLGELALSTEDASWESGGLHAAGLTVAIKGDVEAQRLGLDTLERRQPGIGDLRISKLEGESFRSRDKRASLGGVSAATLEYRLSDGGEFTSRDLVARALSGDVATGIEVEHFSVTGGEGREADGARTSAAALASSGLSVTSAGDVAIEDARLARFSRSAPDAATLDLEGVSVASFDRRVGGELTTARASVEAARLAEADGTEWALARIETDGLEWDGSSRIDVHRAALDSLARGHGERRDWLARSLRAAEIRLTLPGEVEVATLSTAAIGGGTGSPAWTVASVEVEGLSGSEGDGHRIDRLATGAVEVSDARNGAVLSLEGALAQAVEVSVLDELAARSVTVGGLHLGSADPDWPSRLSVAELRVDEPRMPVAGVVDLGEVVARKPYFIFGHSADNVWMWPPLPGGAGDAANAPGEGSPGGIRIGRFATRGAGRVVFMDRSTDPVFQLALDPLVIAIENLDTSLPGNRARLRARGNSPRFAGFLLEGEVIKGVDGFDLALEARLTAIYLRELNPYVKRHEPMVVTGGWGDARARATVENHQLSGELNLLLSGLQLRRTIGGTKAPRITPVNLTLMTALALLKDRQGNISLNVPLDTNTERPDYDFIRYLQSVIVGTVRSAGSIAANVTTRTFDSAVRLIESTVSVLPGVDATRYPPIEFRPGADDITARHLEYLNQLGDRMLEYDSLVLALCGRSVASDRESFSERVSTIDKLFDEASEGVYRVYGPEQEGMLALAEARADTARRYLREVRDVPERQLAPCDAGYDEAPGASPRVDLEIKSRVERRGLFGLLP